MTEPRRSWPQDLHLAFVFLTRLPLPAVGEVPRGALAGAMRAFPLVGAALGLGAGLVFWLAAQALPPPLAALLAVAAYGWLTGFLHEDGLADVADGFGGGHDAARRLEIMRDSRIGGFGAVALILVLGLRAGSLAELAGLAPLALIAAASLSRTAIPFAMLLGRPARADGLGHGAGAVGRASLAWAGLLGLLIAWICLGAAGALAAAAAATVAAAVLMLVARRRIGGYTGDVLGAVQQITEIAVLLSVVGMR